MYTPYTIKGKHCEATASRLGTGKYWLRWNGGHEGVRANGTLGDIVRSEFASNYGLYGSSPEEVIEMGRRFADRRRPYAEVCALKIDGWD